MKPEGNQGKNASVTLYEHLVRRPFTGFEKDSLDIAGRFGWCTGSRSRYEGDLRQCHASKMVRSRSGNAESRAGPHA